jgi:hypothetical protein
MWHSGDNGSVVFRHEDEEGGLGSRRGSMVRLSGFKDDGGVAWRMATGGVTDGSAADDNVVASSNNVWI